MILPVSWPRTFSTGLLTLSDFCFEILLAFIGFFYLFWCEKMNSFYLSRFWVHQIVTDSLVQVFHDTIDVETLQSWFVVFLILNPFLWRSP